MYPEPGPVDPISGLLQAVVPEQEHVTLCALLQNMGKDEALEGNICRECTKVRTSRIRVVEQPKYLAINLARFRSEKEQFQKENGSIGLRAVNLRSVNTKVEFGINFSFPREILLDDQEPLMYTLSAVIFHIGDISGGHYYGYVRSTDPKHPGQWETRNDT